MSGRFGCLYQVEMSFGSLFPSFRLGFGIKEEFSV
jgi:hypothetical protein